MIPSGSRSVATAYPFFNVARRTSVPPAATSRGSTSSRSTMNDSINDETAGGPGGGPSGTGLEHPTALADLAESLGISDIVRFVPPVHRDELVDWYAAATLVCVPSYNESFGLVAVEAQAVGTPVVAAAVGGLTTVVADGRSGRHVDGHDPEDYARVFERIIDAPGLRAALSVGAIAQAADFSWDRTADATLGVYGRAIDLMAVEVAR